MSNFKLEDIPEDMRALIAEPEEDEQEQAIPERHFDHNRAENETINQLIDQGVEFDCPTIYGSWFGKEKRKWTIKYQPYVVLCRMAKEFIKLNLDEDMINEDGLKEAKRTAIDAPLIQSRVIAIAVWGNRPFSSIAIPILTNYFFHRISSKVAMQLAMLLNAQGDYRNFCDSIRLMSSRRVTKPALIEQNKGG